MGCRPRPARSFCFGKRTQNPGRPGAALRVPLPQSRNLGLRNSLRSNSPRPQIKFGTAAQPRLQAPWKWRHGMARLQISATSALSAIVVAASHAACRGRPETDSARGWRGYEEGGPHEMRPLQLKTPARRWSPDQVRDDRRGKTDSSFASLRTSALLRMTTLVFVPDDRGGKAGMTEGGRGKDKEPLSGYASLT